MKNKTTEKKKTAKFAVTRKEVADQLRSIIEDLEMIDTSNEAPSDVADKVYNTTTTLRSVLDDFMDRV